MGDQEKDEVGNIVAETSVLRIGVVLGGSKRQQAALQSDLGRLGSGYLRQAVRESIPPTIAGNMYGRSDDFLELQIFGQHPRFVLQQPLQLPTLTLRSIDHGLEHQWNECNKEKVIDEELGSAPERCRRTLRNGTCAGIFGSGRSRVGGSSGRGGCGNGEASVEGVERIDPPQPGEEGGHFTAVAWRRECVEEKEVGL